MTTSARLLSFGRPFRSAYRGPALALAVLAAMLCTPPSEAVARGRGSMRAYQKFAKQAYAAYQKQVAANQKLQKERYEAFMNRFDTNKNGKIEGKEKGPAKKYLRQLELGIDPDRGIKSMGRSSSFGTRTHSKPASTRTKK